MSRTTTVQVSPTDRPPSDLTSLTEYLESLVAASIDGLNTRTLSTSHLWSFVADDFTSSGMGFAATSKKALEDDYVVYREQFPDHRLEIENMTTTLNSRLITGHVYANVLVAGGHGVPIGMSRSVVMVFEFQKCEGRWWLKATTSLPGEGGILE